MGICACKVANDDIVPPPREFAIETGAESPSPRKEDALSQGQTMVRVAMTARLLDGWVTDGRRVFSKGIGGEIPENSCVTKIDEWQVTNEASFSSAARKVSGAEYCSLVIEPSFLMDDVASNNTSRACWLVIKNQVYDATRFLSSHPGGDKSVLEYAGKECTDAFTSSHSQSAKGMLQRYHIGSLRGATTTAITV